MEKITKITVGGKDYKLPKLDFNAVCELEELGMDFSRIQKMSMSTGRALLALVMKTDCKTAAKAYEDELEKDEEAFNKIMLPLYNMINESDFFQKMARQKTN